MSKSCPCYYTTPCMSQCTCANPVRSGGCQRCCAYGSEEQRKSKAEKLAEIIDTASWPLTDGENANILD
jgi:hypothetical protein